MGLTGNTYQLRRVTGTCRGSPRGWGLAYSGFSTCCDECSASSVDTGQFRDHDHDHGRVEAAPETRMYGDSEDRSGLGSETETPRT